ncbi:MAG: hypothetical protein ACRCZI_03700, partial [Cetobacterium sp.]
GVSNMFGIIKALGNQSVYDELMESYLSGAKMYGKLKAGLSDTLVAFCKPLREKRAEILADKELRDRLYANAEPIRYRAKQTLMEVKEIMGLF